MSPVLVRVVVCNVDKISTCLPTYLPITYYNKKLGNVNLIYDQRIMKIVSCVFKVLHNDRSSLKPKGRSHKPIIFVVKIF